MNNYQQLFCDIKLALTNEIYEKYSKQINEIAKLQKKSVQTILDEIAKIILEYNVKNEVMDISIQEYHLLIHSFVFLILLSLVYLCPLLHF